MKKIAVSLTVAVVAVICVLVFLGNQGDARTTIVVKKPTAQACIGVPPECMGGGE